jgi:uncharacterized protein YjbK
MKARLLSMKKEIELKYRLQSKDDFSLFERFLEQYRCEKKRVLSQENIYFDTPNLNLKKNGMSLRLRKENNDYLLSAKHSLEKKKSKFLSVRLEYEAPVEPHIASLIINENLSPVDAFAFLPAASTNDALTKKALYRYLKKMTKTGVQIIGSFTNLRISMPIEILKHAVVMELDHSYYPKDTEVFEVEIEFASVKQAVFLRPAIEALFRSAGLRTHTSVSKSSRLYKLLYN